MKMNIINAISRPKKISTEACGPTPKTIGSGPINIIAPPLISPLNGTLKNVPKADIRMPKNMMMKPTKRSLDANAALFSKTIWLWFSFSFAHN
jgi:hypothetical protein